MMNILGPDQIRALAERNASSVPQVPKRDPRPLVLPWPETILLAGERKTVQVLPKAAVRMERMIVSVNLLRQTPEETREHVKGMYERTIERLRSELDAAVAYKDALVAGTAVVDDEDDERPTTVDGAHAVIARARERLAYAQTPSGFRMAEERYSWSENPKLELNSIEGAQALVLEGLRMQSTHRLLEDVFPCPAVKFQDGNPETISLGVQAELFAKTPVVEPGFVLSIDLHNTSAFPLIFRAATFCRS